MVLYFIIINGAFKTGCCKIVMILFLALPVRQIIIWKRKGGINFNAGYFLPTYEVIYLIAKPKFRLEKKANGLGDVWDFTQESNNPHPAAFPVSLIERIIGATNAQLILDPFMGKRNYSGCCIKPR